MSNKSTSTERQLFILSLLSQRKSGYTINEIIDSLKRMADIDATRRMVARDMDYISQNFFVYEEEHDGKLVYKADKYALSDMDFSMAEVVSLYFTQQVLQTYESLGMAKDALKIVRRILGKLPELSRSAMENVEKMIKIVPEAAADSETDEETLHSCRKRSKRRAASGSATILFPRARRRNGSSTHMCSRCVKGAGIPLDSVTCGVRCATCVSRIEDAELLGDTFTVPRRFYEDYRKTRFDKLAGEELTDIRVRFTGDAARLVKEYHARKADRLADENGAVLFEKRRLLRRTSKAGCFRSARRQRCLRRKG